MIPARVDNPDELEYRPIRIQTSQVIRNDLLTRYSSLTKLIRVTAVCYRALLRFRHRGESLSIKPLSPEELDDATRYWIKHEQMAYFGGEIDKLSFHKELSKSSPLLKLTPFLDKNGPLRVGGRLKNSLLPTNTKHHFILPRSSHLTALLIHYAHMKTLHGSTQETLVYLRNKYWIIGGRSPVRSFILKCIKCTRFRLSKAQQLMGQLPASRVTPSRAFLHTGIDYAGPFILKAWKERTNKHYKSWIALFVCLATSAIHLEVVSDYTTDAFLAAYRRFASRRGICATLNSDCGTTFKGADKELKQLFTVASTELQHMASLITKWNFNPPAAPHFGGKWEAAVKSMKYHLRRVVGESVLTYEELATLLSQIEAVLNSRPLCPLTEDADDLEVLTPGHFLIGQPLTAISEPNLEHVKSSRLSRWQHVSQMTQSFWQGWQNTREDLSYQGRKLIIHRTKLS